MELKKQFGAPPKKLEVHLPTAPRERPQGVDAYALFIYGHQKIGKTTFALSFPDTLHFAFEPSCTDYECYSVSPSGWEEFKAYVELVKSQKASGALKFKTFVIDIIDIAYEQCLRWICMKQGLKAPPNNDFGQTWRDVKDEFRNTFEDLRRCGGIVCVSHAKEKKLVTRHGDEYDMICPTAPAGATDMVAKWADLTGYYELDKHGNRVLNITPSQEFEAGNRMESRFKDPETDLPLDFIPMGKSSKEAFKNFMTAFNNKLPAVATAEESIPTTKPLKGLKIGAKNG